MYKIICKYCGIEKEVRSDRVKTQKYCSASCGQKYINRERGKEKHPAWKGGKRVNHNGYIEVRKPDHHRSRKNGYVFEHILIAENKIGRSITTSEDVHHINGDKTDNRECNLEVLSKSNHAILTALERKEKNIHLCSNCGEGVYRKPSQVARGKGKVFCSRRCVGLWTSKYKKGEILK